MIAIAACSSGGGDNGGNQGGNNAPTANAGADQSVDELSVVQLNGVGNDLDGDTLSYSWVQSAGTIATITNGNMAMASFTAPDVAAGTPETLTFQLTVGDGTANATDSVDITVAEPELLVTVSGTVNYEFVPPNPNCRGLNFAGTFSRPIRSATVQLLDSSNNVLGTMIAGDDGSYAFNDIDVNTMVRLRVRAELKQTGVPGWDVEVRDNVDISGSPPPLASRPLYVVDGALFDTSSADVTEILTATTGWGGASYTGPRAAAPFAVLDTIYSAMQFVRSADPNANFVPLDVFWSVSNTRPGTANIDTGELGTSFYRRDIDSLFLLGDADVDTEEFDDHVIVHEWGHYFEDNFSRSDSVGGPHSVGDRLDPRLAFGEGWATALSGMALGNQLYCDTDIPGTSGGFGIGAESGSYDAAGWYDEISVIRFIYDMWDNNDEGGGVDTVSIGFGPIYQIMTGPQASTEAFTTVFSFAAELREILNGVDQAGLDNQLAREDMTAAGLDIWGTSEINDAQGRPNVLPIYTDITADGSPLNICIDSHSDVSRDGNKLSEYRYLRVDISNQSRYLIEVDTVNPPSTPPVGYDCNTAPSTDPNIHLHSDPDITIFRDGVQVLPFPEGLSCEPNREVATTSLLSAGTYVLDVTEFRYADSESPADFPSQNETEICFNITIQATN
jgi:hypothetical protein